MYMTDKEIIDDLTISRNLSKSTESVNKFTIKIYTEFHQMSFQELLEEAEKEEEEGIRWKHRTLKRRLITFRTYLYENYLESSAKVIFTKIKTIYNHYEIEIHKIPAISKRNTLKAAPLTYDDLPTREIIQKALEISKPGMRAIILFMTSSGSARRETFNLTIADFIKATYNYHKSEDLVEAIQIMDGKDDIIPMWKLKRQKTNKYYITFSSPESTEAIINYLLSSNRIIDLDSPLFKFNLKYLNDSFKKINNTLDLGKAGTYIRFRSHTLRKFHASQLYNDGMPIEYVDSLQGRSKNSVHSSYFMEDPEKLKQMYMEHMHAISINTEVNTLDVKSKEFIKLEKSYDDLQVKHEKLELDLVSRLEALEKEKKEKTTNKSVAERYAHNEI